MTRLVRLLGIGLFFTSVAAAETFSFSRTPHHIRYRVAHNHVSATVRHPFRVIRLETGDMKGVLFYNPHKPQQGLKFRLRIPVGSLDAGDKRIRQEALALLRRPKAGKAIIATAEGFEVVEMAREPEDPIRFVVRPQVQLAGRTAYPEVRMTCRPDGKVLKCEFVSQFALSNFDIPVPELWGIPGEDRVEVRGEVSFTPGGGGPDKEDED